MLNMIYHFPHLCNLHILQLIIYLFQMKNEKIPQTKQEFQSLLSATYNIPL